MRWRIADLVFDEDRQRLSGAGEDVVLEPRQAELLAYFCRHPGELVSRDRLIENAWRGQVVTDNAVNRTIARLRKSLGDDARQSEFIVTVPRRGYRFAATVEALGAEPAAGAARPSAGGGARRWPFVAAAVAMALVLFVVLYGGERRPATSASAGNVTVTALTREAGEEYLPAAAPGGRYLAYAQLAGDRLDLYLKDLASGSTRRISDGKASAGNGDWSSDGRRFLYLNATDDSCELRILHFDEAMVVRRDEAVHRCTPGSYGNLAFSVDGRRILFSDAADPAGAYRIFVKDLASGEVREPPQPPLFLAGNREFDRHPTEDRLVIASPNARQRLVFHELDLVDDTMTRLFEYPGTACCPIWDHDGEGFLMVGPSPGQKLLAISRDGSRVETLFQAPHSMHRLRRIPGTHSLVYSGDLRNTQILFEGFGSDEARVVVDSVVADYLPSPSPDGRWLAYLSQRSNADQIWLRDRRDGSERQLTDFADEAIYFDLAWSPDMDHLAALTINAIKVVDAVTGSSRTLELPITELRGLSWASDNQLAFSLRVNGAWRAHRFDLERRKLVGVGRDVAYELFDPLGGAPLSIDSAGVLRREGQDTDLAIARPTDHRRRLSIGYLAGIVYVRDGDGDNAKLLAHDLAAGTSEAIMALPDDLFAVASDGIYVARAAPENADIFRIDLP